MSHGKSPAPWVDPMQGGRVVVAHGFRSAFRTWAAEKTSFPREVVEDAMAHEIENAAERAYLRGDLFERRVALMNEWAAYCAKIAPVTNADGSINLEATAKLLVRGVA